MADSFRVEMIVPSSNVTMETEIPAMLKARPGHYQESFTFHSSRMRMQSVTQEELEQMDEQSEHSATLLSDAQYMEELTQTVIDYFEDTGVSVIDYEALECPDNLEVTELDQRNLMNIAEGLDTETADALVISSCVQMPSLVSVQAVEDKFGLPTFSAATATTYEILDQLGLSTQVSGAGRLLDGKLNETTQQL